MRTKSSSKRAASKSKAKLDTNQRRHVLTGISKRPLVPIAHLSERSRAARDRALHALAAMRRDPKLSLTHAAKLQGVKPGTVKKYFSSALKESQGKFRATKGDRYAATLHVPNAEGHSVAVTTHSSKDREALSQYLRDLGRYLRGERDALAPWREKKIAGVELVTDGRTLANIEPALSEFSLYRTANGGAA
jgi:hypothetical protein